MQDRYFDGLSHKFQRQIYRGVKGELRLALLKRDLDRHIPHLPLHAEPLRILDAGGGSGQFAARLARCGNYRIEFCEPSAEMMALAKAEFRRRAPNAQPRFIQAPLQALPDCIDAPQDLVLFHAVIEWLVDPIAALETLAALVKPGGWFSVLFYNARALTWRHLMNGNWEKALSGNLRGRKNSLTPLNAQQPERIAAALERLGFELHADTAIRTIVDNMKPYELKKKNFLEVLEIESTLGQQQPYRQLARYIHLLARKPAHPYTEKNRRI